MISSQKSTRGIQQKNQNVKKSRKETEKQLTKARSNQRQSAANLDSITAKIDLSREDTTNITLTLLQKTSQLDSINRLIAYAQDRLHTAKESVSQLEYDIKDSDNDVEKQRMQSMLQITNTGISELESEIKYRQELAARISTQVSSLFDQRQRINSKIQKHVRAKSALRDTLKTSNASAKPAPRRAATKKTASAKPAPRSAATKKTASAKPAPRSAATKKTASAKPAPRSAATKKTASAKPAPRSAATKKTDPVKTRTRKVQTKKN